MMLAILCALAALPAISGVPPAALIPAGLSGMLLGFAPARSLIPRKDMGMLARTLLHLPPIGGMIVGGPQHLSAFDFHSVRGMLAHGLYFGFRVGAVPRLTEPTTPEPPAGGRP